MSHAIETPACLTRDNLTSDYFPSLGRTGLAATIALCVIFFFTGIHRLNHTDLWGHLAYGRWISEHGTLPHGDPFAAEAGQAVVMQHAWLTQYLAYHWYQLAGRDGLIFAHAFLETLAAGIIMLAVARRGARGIWPAAAGVMFVVLSLPIMGTIRPQLFAQVGMALVFLALSELPQKKHPLFWLPLVFAAWANLHASTVVGLGVVGLVAAGRVFDAFQTEGKLNVSVLKTHAIAFLGCVVGACLNPHGIGAFFRAGSFGANTAVSQISEWQPVSPTSLTGALLVLSAIAAVLIFRQLNERTPWYEIALLVLFAVATVFAIRMLVWWALAWSWIVIPWAARLAASFQTEKAPEEKPQAMSTVLAMGIVFTTLILAPPTHSFLHGRTRGEATTMSPGTPYHVADELARRKLQGAFFAPMDWSDYIVWQSHGELRPLVYSHVHLASPEAWEAYRQLSLGTADALKLARENNLKYLVASRERSRELVGAIYAAEGSRKNPLRIIYQDRKCLVAELLPVGE